MQYWQWLILLSLGVLIAERIAPERPAQRLLRPQLGGDLVYLVVYGHFYAVWFGGWSAALASGVRDLVRPWMSLAPSDALLADAPWPLAFLGFLVVSDFLQWCIHNLLHRVPQLWAFHKVHHSVHAMDWAANFRFHWIELVVYRSLTYVPLALLGGAPSALFAAAVFATLWGHLNHANVRLRLGPLGYVLNSPRMHMWHHDATEEGRPAKNFGIVFSLWDVLFGTVYWPRERAPLRIGYRGDDEMPSALLGQLAFPLWTRRGAGSDGTNPGG